MSTVVVTVGLAAIWVLLWGSASFANVLTGLALGLLLTVAVPGLRRAGGGHFPLRPIAIARFVAHVVGSVVASNIVLTREVVAPTDRIRTAVIAVPLPACSDELVTLISNVVALAPGTMPLELRRDPVVLYVHVLHLRDLESMRQEILDLTDLAVRAFGSPEAIAAQDEHVRNLRR